MSSPDRRRYARFPSFSRADLRIGMSWLNGALVDIALRGALFETESASYGLNGRACRLHLPLNLDPINGIIVHSDDGLLGIKFIGITERLQEDLMLIVASSQEEPSLLDREWSSMVNAHAPNFVGN